METPRFYGRSAAIRAARTDAARRFVASHADPFILLDALTHRLKSALSSPRGMALACALLFAFVGTASAAAPLGAPMVAGMFQAKRSFSIAPIPTDGGTSEFKITRGMVQAGVVISTLYSVNVTVTGAAVRAYSLPIRRISLIGDNGKTLQSWRATDLIRVAQIWEQTPIGALIVPASGFGVANYTALEAHVPLMFEQPRSPQGQSTALPTFGYADLTLRIEWGTVTDLLTGTPTGTITFTAGGSTVTQLDYADLPIRDGLAAVRAMPVAIGRYAELIQAAAANTAAEIDLGTTQNIRAIMLVSELASTGEPTNTIVNKVSLQEDNTNFVFSNVPWATMRADNSKHFGLTMPTGVAIMDFAHDGDIARIYRAVQKSKVKNILDTAAIAGTIRAAVMGIEPPLRV